LSIIAHAISEPHLLPVWLVWTGVSLLLMQAAMTGRSKLLLGWQREPLDPLIYFVPLAGAMFVLWVMVGSMWAGVYRDAGVTTPTPKQVALQAMLTPLVPMLVGLFVLLRRRQRPIVGLEWGQIRGGVLWGLLGITVALPIVWWSLQATLAFWEFLQYEHPTKHSLLLEMDRSTEWWVHAMIIAAAVVVAPVFEELLFRGLLQTSLRKISASPLLAIGLASLVFAVIHPHWQAPPIFVLSVMVGAVYEVSRNLWAAIVMHAAFNAFAIVSSS
jgi:membrane protease YdiL (CAAX protease family)